MRGKCLLLHAGYRYNFERKNKAGSTFWRCCSRNVCRACLHITNANAIREEDNHVCRPDFNRNIILKEFDNCQKRIITDVSSPVTSIYRDTVNKLLELGLDVSKDKIPEFNSIKNKLYRKRNKYLSQQSKRKKNL